MKLNSNLIMKESLYKTALVAKNLPGINAGEFVRLVRYHEFNGTYTIRSISGVDRSMVDPSNLTDFVL